MGKHKIIGTAVGVILFLLLSQLLPEVRCADGWRSPSIGRQGACSHHGGVRRNTIWVFLIIGVSIAAGTATASYFEPKYFQPSRSRNKQRISDSYLKETEIIQAAIASHKKIAFLYKKQNAQVPEVRMIQPSGFKYVAHKWGGGSTFCVVGHCELRKAERTFALKRMSDIRILGN